MPRLQTISRLVGNFAGYPPIRLVHNACEGNNLYSKFNKCCLAKTLFLDPRAERTTTYGQHYNTVCRLSRWLANNGLAEGDRLVAQIAKSGLAIALCHACFKNGVIYVPLTTAYRSDELRYFIQDVQPKVAVTSEQNVSDYASFCPKETTVISDSRLAIAICQLEALDSVVAVSKDHPAAICYTSGTTGRPKGVMISHDNLTSNAVSLENLWEIDEHDTLLHALPLDHVHGLFISLNPCMMAGASVVLLASFQVESTIEWLARCSLMMGVPTYYSRLLEQGHCNRRTLGHLRLLISGSAPLPTKMWFKYAEDGGQEIVERYGMTEGQIVCSNPVRGKRIAGTVGKPLEGIEVAIRDDVLYYKGPNTFKGYWQKPEKTKEDFTEDGFFNSGDLATIQSDGYVQITGRQRDVIISGGLNVFPKEVESVIDSMEWILENAVIGVPHADYGEAVVAVVVLKINGDGRTTESKIVNELKDRIASYKVPKRVVFVKALPKNIMGKVQKDILRQYYRHLFDA